MTFSKEAMLAKIEYRINMLTAKDPVANRNLINALIREKRNMEARV